MLISQIAFLFAGLLYLHQWDTTQMNPDSQPKHERKCDRREMLMELNAEPLWRAEILLTPCTLTNMFLLCCPWARKDFFKITMFRFKHSLTEVLTCCADRANGDQNKQTERNTNKHASLYLKCSSYWNACKNL